MRLDGLPHGRVGPIAIDEHEARMTYEASAVGQLADPRRTFAGAQLRGGPRDGRARSLVARLGVTGVHEPRGSPGRVSGP